MSSPIELHFDFLSPYAYLAWTQIHTLAAAHGREVMPVPTLFAALLTHNQTRGPAEIPSKRLYVFKDSQRTARALGVPFAPPPTHPFSPLVALRASSVLDGEPRRRLVSALFDATWGGGDGVDTAEKVARQASLAGLDGPALVARAGTEEAKAKLRAQTDLAIDRGVFGVPTMWVDGELFWGYDSFPHLSRFLDGRDPLTPEDVAKWAHVTPSARRNGA